MNQIYLSRGPWTTCDIFKWHKTWNRDEIQQVDKLWMQWRISTARLQKSTMSSKQAVELRDSHMSRYTRSLHMVAGHFSTFLNSVHFQCDDGFKLLGSSERVCQANGTWSRSRASCNGKFPASSLCHVRFRRLVLCSSKGIDNRYQQYLVILQIFVFFL